MKAIHGRGTAENPPNRFEPLHVEKDEDFLDGEELAEFSPSTRFFKETARSIISRNDSPDVGLTATINPYRGCEHGCIYCYARPTHEYLGFSSGLDFETKIIAKENAPELLRKELQRPQWKPQVLGMSGITDCYQPLERRLQLTRRCLEVLAEFRNPVAVITKNYLVTRDIDVLKKLAEFECAVVFISITTLNADLQRVMEPRAAHPRRRLEAIRQLAGAGIPVGVNVAPVVPGLTEHELPSIVGAAVEAGAAAAGYVVLRLPYSVAHLFEEWVTRHFPDRKDKILNRIRSIRGGKLNDPNFNSRMEGQGIYAREIAALFALACKKSGIAERENSGLSTRHFRRPAPGGQLEFL